MEIVFMSKGDWISIDKLLKMLEDADLPDEAKRCLDVWIKSAYETKDNATLKAIHTYLLWKKSSTYGFKATQREGDIRFYLGSHIAVFGQPRTGKSMFIMRELARLANGGYQDEPG
jgi:hypothetical protein